MLSTVKVEHLLWIAVVRNAQIVQMYLSKSQNVFVQITKCIWTNYKMYLDKSQNVIVPITKIKNYKIYSVINCQG